MTPIDKKPFFHLLPGAMAFSLATARCSLRRSYCQNYTTSQWAPEENQNHAAPPASVVTSSAGQDASAIAYAWSEPIFSNDYVLDAAHLVRRTGLWSVVISDGYVNPEPLRELCRTVTSTGIDPKSSNDEFY